MSSSERKFYKDFRITLWESPTFAPQLKGHEEQPLMKPSFSELLSARTDFPDLPITQPFQWLNMLLTFLYYIPSCFKYLEWFCFPNSHTIWRKYKYLKSIAHLKLTHCLNQLSDQIILVAQSCPTLCNPMNRSTPGLPVHHQLLEFTQTHVHQVSDAIQPSHPLSSPSPPAPNPSQHQGLFQWINSSHEVAKVLELQL